MDLPHTLPDEAALDELMTRPRAALVAFVQTLHSPLVILGAGGKMGPTLAVLARRAADAAGRALDVIAVSRFSDAGARAWLEAQGVRTLSCDLMDRDAVARLPDAQNVIYLVGMKFGTTDNPALTWAINTLAPAHTAQRYAQARIVALSTGNVYPLAPVEGGGSREGNPLTPLGEYANSAVARERIFEHFSRRQGTPVALMRLSYAVDLRYGVLVDIALKVYRGEPVDVTTGYMPYIWQGDANEMIIRSLALAASPPAAFNLTGPAPLSTREVALRLGDLMGRPVTLVGKEADTAFLSNTARLQAQLGAPPTPLEPILRWTAAWIASGGRLLDKPTHFEVRDGAY
ncbi:MAG: NAD(P)-dependent oxidoreductase [Anaerolineae bacterium]|nr:NAD(P)-dependent oxidoreductase [Anaerolineae bacterium]